MMPKMLKNFPKAVWEVFCHMTWQRQWLAEVERLPCSVLPPSWSEIPLVKDRIVPLVDPGFPKEESANHKGGAAYYFFWKPIFFLKTYFFFWKLHEINEILAQWGHALPPPDPPLDTYFFHVNSRILSFGALYVKYFSTLNNFAKFSYCK